MKRDNFLPKDVLPSAEQMREQTKTELELLLIKMREAALQGKFSVCVKKVSDDIRQELLKQNYIVRHVVRYTGADRYYTEELISWEEK